MKKIKTIKELQNTILNNTKYGGCAIDLPDGSCIGTTSGGFQPLYYINEDDRTPQSITWGKALQIYNQAVSKKTVVYDLSMEDAQDVADLIETYAEEEEVDKLLYDWWHGNTFKEEIYMKLQDNM